MSRENVEAIRGAIRHWIKTGIDESLVHPDVELDTSTYPAPDLPPMVHGRREFARFFNDYRATWDTYEAVAADLIDAGDDVVLTLHETVRARGSDTPMERDITLVFTMRDGRIVRAQPFHTTDEALAALDRGTVRP
jgi:ketosteroid isomerase-like protein